jgi:hypothetical protein
MAELPSRFREFSAFLATTGADTFGDWQLSPRNTLTNLVPEGEAGIVGAASSRFVRVAGSFSGGVLVVDVAGGDPERAPVVEFGSEGEITVLGASFDDFLALLAAEEPEPLEDGWVADDALRAWIVAQGIAPHPEASARLALLAEATRQLSIEWTAALREASRRLRPDEVVEHRLVLGERIGDVSLGMARDALDARWGKPETPEWARTSKEVGAFYKGAPFGVTLDRSARRVIGVSLRAGRHRAVTVDGVDPMFMRDGEATAWLASSGVASEAHRGAIEAPLAKTRLGLDGARGARDALRWVNTIELFDADA